MQKFWTESTANADWSSLRGVDAIRSGLEKARKIIDNNAGYVFASIVMTREAFDKKFSKAFESPFGDPPSQPVKTMCGYPIRFFSNNIDATIGAAEEAAKTGHNVLLVTIEQDSIVAKVFNGAAIQANKLVFMETSNAVFNRPNY